MPTYFSPPVRRERIPTQEKPFKYYTQPVSMSVVKRNGRFQEVRVAHDYDENLTEGTEWFTGGRTYLIDEETALLLEADGFETFTTGPIFGGG